ncbi:MAG: hypothetical protein AAB676_11555 [Verrucomicrobiota bacterium]
MATKENLRREAELKRRDRDPVVVLDDSGCVQQDREEMEVLFTCLAERYERWPRDDQHQPGVLEMGSDLQGSVISRFPGALPQAGMTPHL